MKIKHSEIKKLVATVHEKYLTEEAEYNSTVGQSLASEIRNLLKAENFDRIKFIVECLVLEKSDGGLTLGLRSLVDNAVDSFVSVNGKSTNLNVHTLVQWIYQY